MKYIELIKSCDVRNIFTRLRIDCHILESSQRKLNKSSNGICPNCDSNVIETPIHFLLNCQKFASERTRAYEILLEKDSCFSMMNETEKVKYILNLDCPDSCINICCNFVSSLYRKRVKLEEN